MMGNDDNRNSSGPAVRFPVLKSLRVDGYGLYPGAPPRYQGLNVDFLPGLTVVLGANGLGKTTLVWMLYRLMAGPVDITSLDSGGDLGSRKLVPRKLRRQRLEMFAQRVTDRAKEATGYLVFRLGESIFVVKRRFSDLKLLGFEIDGGDTRTDEKSYQEAIARAAGLGTFGDWILTLRYLTFYFEDRRELVWDSSAQKQILRFLFLPSATALEWTKRERKILTLDSRARNLGATLKRAEAEIVEFEEMEVSAPDVRQQLESLTTLQVTDEERREALDEKLIDLDAARQEARLALLRSEQDREATFRALEHAKLLALEERFPSSSETARYLLAQLLTEAECLACGNEVPEIARALEARLDKSQCVVCGSQLPKVEFTSAEQLAILTDQRLKRYTGDLEDADFAVESARELLEDTDQRYSGVLSELQELDAIISRRSERLDTLRRRLPPEIEELREQRDGLALLRRSMAKLKKSLAEHRSDFAEFVDSASSSGSPEPTVATMQGEMPRS